MEYKQNQFTISNDPSRLDVDVICDFLSRAYWADKRLRSDIERSIENSINFGIYDGDRQIGFARVLSDKAVFAYIMDVFVHEDYRGKGLGKWLMECIMAHPELQRIRRWMLATNDAHELYRQFGFTEIDNPGLWMHKFDPSIG
ncbi:MAG: GNAT family N-acetyltransferase [Anaerolineales bacterium]|nr:GNAT family N-acetyltransferase [Anaerolineales bacterium]